jgi:hypothetical protein
MGWMIGIRFTLGAGVSLSATKSPACSSMGTETYYPEVKKPEGKIHHLSLPSAEVRNAWNFNFAISS